jgi:hypothetical protein
MVVALSTRIGLCRLMDFFDASSYSDGVLYHICIHLNTHIQVFRITSLASTGVD